MKILIALSILMSFSAFANDYAFDCRTGGPQGGKFCYYQISQCERTTCEEAAECMIDTYGRWVTWEELRSVRNISSKIEGKEAELQYVVVSKKFGKQVRTITAEIQENGLCLPVAAR